ncbi:MAG: dephospho-CoA kinase [Bacteroidia bacterium]|nr:dephospho-CoA kinase [Bacteroidia bacterium]
MIIGLTGGIGSGKSTVSKLFEILGYAVFYSDDVAKEVYFDQVVKRQVVELLGPESYVSDLLLNKSFISSRIFSDTILLHRLNAIIHPAVKERMMQFVADNKHKHVVKESALLFEARLDKEVDKIVVVAAEEEIVIERVMKRDGANREDVIKRIKSQMPPEEKIRRADFVIYNNEQQLLITQVLEVHRRLFL